MKKIFLSIIYIFFASTLLFANPGKDIFDKFCMVCHSPSMAPMFNAPAAHDINAWNDRKLDALNKAIEVKSSIKNLNKIEKEEISIDALVRSAISGTDKGMPPKGTCGDCSDNDLKSVIIFMSSSN